jgi:hypothetical protein
MCRQNTVIPSFPPRCVRLFLKNSCYNNEVETLHPAAGRTGIAGFAEGETMEEMFKMMDDMIDKMCSEDRMKLMQRCLDRCMSGMSPEESAEAVKDACSGGAPRDGAWEQMPNMIMSMMGMMCVRMMDDMTKGGSASGGGNGPMSGMMGGRGPMGGMMGGGGGPMKMMQKMMSSFGNQPAAEPSKGETADTGASSEKSGDSG